MGINPNQRFYIQPKPNDKKRFIVFEFFSALRIYLTVRSRQALLFGLATGDVMLAAVNGFKTWLVRRMFWGRSSLYRSSFHLVVSVITITAVLSGISTRLNISSASTTQGLDLSSGIIGRQDIFSQAGTAESISIVKANDPDYPVFRHVVEPGETLSEIAELYKIQTRTIKWANNMSSDTIRNGQVLRIPGIDGAFVKVKSGDSLESIARKYKGNVADIVDLNSSVLGLKNPTLKAGMELFIPGGEVPLPPVVVATRSSYSPRSSYTGGTSPGVSLPPGTFVNPLGNCPGYIYIRGFAPWHGGVDLAKSGGCWINAAGAGKVLRAGWGYGGEGFHVVIDHGNGVWTRYYHGNGSFAVSTGQQVKAGQSILYMGCTGYCTGTHLHFEVVINGVRSNPEAYVRVR